MNDEPWVHALFIGRDESARYLVLPSSRPLGGDTNALLNPAGCPELR